MITVASINQQISLSLDHKYLIARMTFTLLDDCICVYLRYQHHVIATISVILLFDLFVRVMNVSLCATLCVPPSVCHPAQ